MPRRSKRPPAATLVPPRETMAPTRDAPLRDVLPFMATPGRAPAPPSTVGLPFLPPAPKVVHGAIAITAGPELGAAALPRTDGVPEKPPTLLDAMNGAALERNDASTMDDPSPPRTIAAARASRGTAVQCATILDLLWFDPSIVPRIRAHAEWVHLIARDVPPPPDTPHVPESPDLDGRRVNDDIVAILARAPVIGAGGFARAVEASLNEHGAFVAPLVVVDGDLVVRFDARDRARAMIAALTPMVAHDVAASAQLTAARKALDDPALEGARGLADAIMGHVRSAMRKVKNDVTEAFLEAAATRAVAIQRRYAKVPIFGAKWIPCELVSHRQDAPALAYIPESLSPLLPLAPRFAIRAIADIALGQDAEEKPRLVLRIRALARAVPRSSLYTG